MPGLPKQSRSDRGRRGPLTIWFRLAYAAFIYLIAGVLLGTLYLGSLLE